MSSGGPHRLRHGTAAAVPEEPTSPAVQNSKHEQEEQGGASGGASQCSNCGVAAILGAQQTSELLRVRLMPDGADEG